VEMHGAGCGSFGQEVLVGERRRCTAVAHTAVVETFIMERDDLLRLFDHKELTVDLRRLCHELLEDFMARERISNIKRKLRMGRIFTVPSLSAEERAGLRLLFSWRRHRQIRAKQNDALFKVIKSIVRGEGQTGRRNTIIPDSFKKKPARGALTTGGGSGWTAEGSVAIEQLSLKQDRLQADMDELLEGMAQLLTRIPPTTQEGR